MKGFLLRTLLFLVPLVCLVTPPLLVLSRSGECFRHFDGLLAGSDPYLIGYSTHEDNYQYLKWRTLALRPRVVVMAIGSSRVLQFRKQMFTVPYYNAGYTVNAIDDYRAFLEGLPHDKLPRVLLLELDQWMFNDAHCPPKASIKPTTYWRDAFRFWPVGKDLFTASGLLLGGDLSMRMLADKTSPARIGLSAYVNDAGLRNDGSMNYGQRITSLEHTAGFQRKEFENTFYRVENGVMLFEYGNHANQGSSAALDRLLAYCKTKRISVTGFLPPLPDAVRQKMGQTGKYGYIAEIDAIAAPVFKRYGFGFYDFGCLETIGGSDREMLDGFHGSEVAAARMLLKMTSDPALSGKIDQPDIEARLAKRKSDFRLYPD